MRTFLRLTPRIVAIVGLALTFAITWWMGAAARAEHEEVVLRTAETLRTAITSEVNGLEVALQTIRQGLRVDDGQADPAATGWPVDVAAFQDAVQRGVDEGTLDVARAISLVRAVPAADVEDYQQAVAERDGVGSFIVHPDRVNGTAYVLESVWPTRSNEPVLGFDLGSERRRREALEMARDSGTSAATEPVRLLQEPRAAGILLIVPAYDDGTVPRTGPVRRDRFVGAVTAAVEPARLLQAATLLDLHLDVTLLDVGPITVLDTPSSQGSSLLIDGRIEPATATSLDLHVGNRRWRLLVQEGDGFRPLNALPILAWALAGLVMTALCTALTHVVLNREATARAMVARRTNDLAVAQTELEEANARLREADALKTSFLVTVSHELRTPLTTIRGFANLLEHQGGQLTAEDRQSFLSQMARSAEGLSALLQEVLEFAELEQFGPSELRLGFDLSAVVLEAVEEFGPGQHIALQLVPDLVAIGDPRSLQRALVNILSNARAYAPSGATIGVWAGPGPDTGMVEVVVDDEGPGIAAAERRRVFERFYRGAEAAAGTVPGTGIGLTVARQLMRSIGGDVQITDAPSGGARLTLRLPRAQGMRSSADGTMSTAP